MIRKRAIDKFLNRQRKDYRLYKKLTDNELQKVADALPASMPLWKKLRKHQRVCALIGAITSRFAFHCDTGTGKTLLSVALIRYFRRLGKVRHAIVLVPNRVNKNEWAREIRKHSPKTSFRIMSGSSLQKWQALGQANELILIDTYAGFIRMCSTLVPSRKKGKEKLKPNVKSLRLMQQKFQMLVCDEVTSAKNRRSLPYRICNQMSKTVEAIFTLTGTPFGRDPTDLWAQMHLVDRGETLGETLGLFRSAFFSQSKNPWGGFDYTFDRRKKPLLHRFLANRSIRYTADKSDLPTLVPITKYMSLPTDADVYYQKAKETIIAAHGNYQEMKNAFLRMRQISSGFVGYFDDEQGVRAEFEFPYNPKLQMLLSIIQSIREDRKIIVFHDFVFSGSMIVRELEKLKIDHARIRGGGDSIAARNKFDDDPKCRVLLLSNSVPFGLNLQVAKYGIYYESPVSAIIRKQTRARFERQGSKHGRVFQYDLIVRGTVDQQIIDYIAQGQNLFDAIVEGRLPTASIL